MKAMPPNVTNMDRTQGVPVTAPYDVVSPASSLTGMSDRELQLVGFVAREAFASAPAVVDKLGKTKGVGQWVAIGLLAAGFVAHLVGDGSLRDKVDRTEAKVDRTEDKVDRTEAKVDRTECHVEWLVEREVAKDRGEPLPAFHPLACGR